MLRTDCKHPTAKTLRVYHKSSTVMLESSCKRFLSRSLNDLTSNHKSGLRFGWVEVLSPFLSFNQVLYVFLEKKGQQIQKKYNLRKKIVENNNICELWHLFFMVINLHMHFHKSFIGLGLHPRIVAYKRKLLLVK